MILFGLSRFKSVVKLIITCIPEKSITLKNKFQSILVFHLTYIPNKIEIEIYKKTNMLTKFVIYAKNHYCKTYCHFLNTLV